MYHEVFCDEELKLQDFFFYFLKGNPTVWNPDKITSVRQAQM